MFLEKDLKQLGIEEVEKLPDQMIIDISGQVATKLVVTFSESNLNYLEIYRLLLETPMFYANISSEIAKANYYYKNSSIYFSRNLNLEQLNEEVFHECIHKIQEHRDKKGSLTRMGICEINELTVKATALNEAAIQYITSKALKNEYKLLNVYNITFRSRTEYYPILANLISQIVFLIGEETLVDSAINSNENFKFDVIDTLGESEYNFIERNFDNILKAKNNILELQKNPAENAEAINENSKNIADIYFEIQNVIFTSYFEKSLKRVETLDEISRLRKKLYSYRSLIGMKAGYDSFDVFCVDMDKRAKDKMKDIQSKTSIAVIKDNLFFRIIRKIKKLFISSQNEYNK